MGANRISMQQTLGQSLRDQLASALRRAEAAELENAAWRALVEWARVNNRSIEFDLDGFAANDEHGKQSIARLRRNGVLHDAGEVTVELATKLGLLDSASPVKP